MKILLLEDNINLHESLKAYLQLENFTVHSAYSSDDVYELTYSNRYDLYIFDINVKGDNGFKILSCLRAINDNTPTFFTTAQTDTPSIAKGFDIGAEEYIKKPFDPEELVVRIKHKFYKEQNHKGISYNLYTKEIQKNGKIVVLGEVLSNIFHTLFINKNHLVAIEDLYILLEHPTANALRVNINRLKRVLEIEIKNIRNIGYMLEDI